MAPGNTGSGLSSQSNAVIPTAKPAIQITKAANVVSAVQKPPAFQIQTLQNRKRWLKALYYGKNGAGKTELAGTCADVDDMGDVFLVNAEKGEMTLEQTDRIKHKERISIVNCDNIVEVEQIRQWLLAHIVYRDQDNEVALKKLEAQIGLDNPGKARRYRTVIVDSLTELQVWSMQKILGINNTMAFDASIPEREWGHYNKMLANVQIMARAFRDMQMNVILLCQEQETQDENKKRIRAPYLEGQMAKRIMGFVDQVGYIKVEREQVGQEQKDVRYLVVQPGYGFEAKNRAGSFKGNNFRDPYMPEIVKAIGWGAAPTPTN